MQYPFHRERVERDRFMVGIKSTKEAEHRPRLIIDIFLRGVAQIMGLCD